MSKKVELAENPTLFGKMRGGSYMTQMLSELAIQARGRNLELAYLVEMAALHSHELDTTERKAEPARESTAA